MAQLQLALPDTLQYQLEKLAQQEGVSLQQYILYILSRQVNLAHTLHMISEDDISQQEINYIHLRQQWGKASPKQIEALLATRKEVDPEPELKPEVIEKLHRLMDEKRKQT
ncbi:hypothetical protein [Candidatus Entotheonella palauensis]|nr:hypothetical protein [Candidatus Entotheonella palauensis]